MDKYEQLRKSVRAYAKSENIMSLVSYAFQDGEFIYQDVFGYKNQENYEFADFDTIYRSASVSKHVSLVVLLTLVDKGLLDLDEDISTYFGYKIRNPYFPNDPITTRMLVTFTSSLSELGTYAKVNEGELPPYMLSEILKEGGPGYSLDNYINYKPGTHVRYSNLSLGMVGTVVEKITGKKFAQYAKEAVFEPLAMTASYDPRTFTEEESKRIATPYEYGYDEAKNPYLYLGIKGPDTTGRALDHKLKLIDLPIGESYRSSQGNLYVVPTDLIKIETLLMNRGVYKDIRILSEKITEEIFTVYAVDNEPGIRGVGTEPIKQGLVARMYDHFIPGGYRVAEFSGRNYGAFASIVLCPEKNFGVVTYSNGMNWPMFSYNMVKPQKEIIEILYRYLF